jgi:hypothetical protein
LAKKSIIGSLFFHFAQIAAFAQIALKSGKLNNLKTVSNILGM